MKTGIRTFVVVAFTLAGFSSQAAAQGTPATEANQPRNAARPAAATEDASMKEESSVTDHTIRIDGQVIPYKATAFTIQIKNAGRRTDRPHVRGRLHAQRRQGPGHAARFVLLQRRPGLGIDVAAHGRVRSPPRLDARRRLHRAGALQARRQHREPPRQDRHGVHRRDGHRATVTSSARESRPTSTASTRTWTRSASSSTPTSTATTAGTRRSS